jgi:type II secretory pathway component GspD/PulD (secretin)
VRFPAREQWEGISKRMLPELDKIVEENKKKTEQLRLIPNPTENSVSKVIDDALNTMISFEFVDTPLRDVIIFVREKTNVNMVIDPEAGGIPVTLKLKDVDFRTALKYILPKGYEYVIEGDIVHFYKQKMDLRVYDVRDILINLDDKQPLEFDITAATSAQMGVRKGEVGKKKEPSERVLDLIELIVTTVEPSSWSSRVSVIGASGAGQRSVTTQGLGEGSIIARMGQPGDLVVVNSKYVHEQIENLLASLRSAQNLQVSIEARFITVSDEFLEDIGNNFTEFFSDKTSIDVGADKVSGALGGDAAIEGLNFNYSILNGNMLKGFLKAVQENKDSEILTSPRITLSNTQRGNIAVVKTINYIQSTSVSEGVVTPVIGTVPEGTTFDVRPIVSADRKNIYIEVTPSVFEVEEITSFTFSGLSSDATVGGTSQGTTIVPPEQTVQLPKVNVSQVSVTVCVPDKGTLMIGGLGSISKKNLSSGIPILSKIPVIKRLFSRDQKTSKKSNLIILLKPTILIREEQEANFLSQSGKGSVQ